MLNRRIFMKELFFLVAVATVLAAPAFAQNAPTRQDNRAWSSSVHPYAAGYYTRPQYEHNNNANPDFQLGGDRG
jgi:hypothetical protein